MGIFDGCLLACDVDDTLVASGYINPENIEKIESEKIDGFSETPQISSVSRVISCTL